MSKMRIDVSFSGCSCGCTPSEYYTFEGEEPDIYIKIAEWANDYLTYGEGESIFRKLNIPEQSKVILRQVNTLQETNENIRCSINKKNNEIKKYYEASEILRVAIPKEFQDKIVLLREDIQKLSEDLNNNQKEIIKLLIYDVNKIS